MARHGLFPDCLCYGPPHLGIFLVDAADLVLGTAVLLKHLEDVWRPPFGITALAFLELKGTNLVIQSS